MLNKICFSALLIILFSGINVHAKDMLKQPLHLETMGSLAFGGNVTTGADGDTFHGDHGYAQFYIPVKAHQYPIILWHGVGQSGSCFESTPDGREGFQAILPRRHWSTYIIDQPRRGRAGHTLSSLDPNEKMPTTEHESETWNAFRNGIWTPPREKGFFEGSQFPATPAAIEQFFRKQTPNTGAEPRDNTHRRFMGTTMTDLLRRTGPAILTTHSNSGQYGWFTGMASPDKVKAIIALEPGQFVFPDDKPVKEKFAQNKLAGELLAGISVPREEFLKLTKFPILVVYGDNIFTEPSDIFNVEVWRLSREYAKDFVAAINEAGGDATLLELPQIGIRGNTHAMFADLNNLQIADELEKWLATKKLTEFKK